DFNAISGLFYMADKHFELFFQASLESRREAVKSLSSQSPDLSQDVNLDSMTAYLAWKFPDRKISGPQSVSELVAELRSHGYATLESINTVLDKGREEFLAHERESPPGPKPPSK